MQPTILLDTQVLIWLLEDDAKLGQQNRQLVLAKQQTIAASYFSLLELTFKTASGKLKTYDIELKDYLQKTGIDLILPTGSELHYYRIFSPENKDPFDNLLIATALENGYSFMTADRKILDTKTRGLKLIDATK
ncbi:MAG: type II toxin-antitoxin system VapC family toxin [Candidatus Saccharimonadales bacterium]